MGEQTQGKAKRRWGRRIGIALGVVLLVVVVLIALLPTLLSTGTGKGIVLGVVNDSIRGSVAAEDLDLSWFGGQAVRGVTLRDPAGDPVAVVRELAAPDVNLLPLVFGGNDYGEVRVDIAEANVTQRPGEATNLAQAVESPGPDAAPEEPAALPDARLRLRLTADRVTYQAPDVEPVELVGLAADIDATDLQNIGLQVETDLQQRGEAGRVAADLSLIDAVSPEGVLQYASAGLTGEASLVNLPVAMVDRLAGQEGRILATLGPTLTARLDARRQPDGPVALDAEIQSPRLSGPLVGTLQSGGLITLTTPRPLQFTATPDAVAAWLAPPPETSLPPEVPPEASAAAPAPEAGSPPVQLAAPAELSINLQDLSLALLPTNAEDETFRLDPERTRLIASVQSPVLALRMPTSGETVRLEGVNFVMEGTDLRELLEVLFEATVEGEETPPGGEGAPSPPPGAISQPATAPDTPVAEVAPAQGVIRSKTAIRHLLAPDGRVTLDRAAVTTDTTLENVPSSLIAAVAGQPDFAAVLGPTLSADADVAYRPGEAGVADIEVTSANVTGRIPAAISPAGVLSLREPATLALQVTPQVADVFLKQINPIFASVVSAELPLKLTVSPEAFRMPLTGFDWQQVSLAARLDTGTLTLNKADLFGKIISLLEETRLLESHQHYGLRLSPVGLTVDEGVLAYDGLRLQADEIDLIFGGQVNLATDRLELLLSLGEQFGVRELRGLQIPITGTISQPQISTEALQKSLLQRGLQIGVQRGLEELLDQNAPRTPPGTISQPGDQPSPEEDAAQPEAEEPVDPFQQLLRRGLERLEQRQREEEAERPQE